MGANISQTSSIDESTLVFTGSISCCPFYSIRSCVCKCISFKETTLVQYMKEPASNLPDKLTRSATFKAILNTEFTQEKLIDHALQGFYIIFNMKANLVKHLSHPSVIRVYSSVLSAKLYSLFLVSEPNLPLQNALEGLTRDEFLMGIYSILQAVDFLHTRVRSAFG